MGWINFLENLVGNQVSWVIIQPGYISQASVHFYFSEEKRR
jgi:hypothetical protein